MSETDRRDHARQAVATYFEREPSLFDDGGNTVTFQVYRANLHATSLTDLQGPQLVELTLDAGEISRHDTVATVKERVLAEFVGIVQPMEHVTFVFDRRSMDDDTLFFADHFIAVPAWVQVVIHEGSYDDVRELVRDLSDRITARP